MIKVRFRWGLQPLDATAGHVDTFPVQREPVTIASIDPSITVLAITRATDLISLRRHHAFAKDTIMSRDRSGDADTR
jgi:hypothetical protein